MADTKISGLTALTTPALEDLLAIVDDPGGTPVTKKVTLEDVLSEAFDKGARVYNSAAQSIGDSSATALTFDTEAYDTDTIHDTGSNTSRMTCNTAGTYSIKGHFTFSASDTGYRRLYFYLNNATVIADAKISADTGGTTVIITLSTEYELAATDYVEAFVVQTSGDALNCTTQGARDAFIIRRVA